VWAGTRWYLAPLDPWYWCADGFAHPPARPVSTRLVDRLARRRTDRSRRTVLQRAALVGTALAVAPRDFVLRPVSAYAAVCSCSNQSCPCGSLCCDGYTEFCCTLQGGTNWCPPGAVTGGWWKVDASQFCGGSAPRYYLDCHNGCGGCGCSGGICSGACSNTPCSCANGDCGNRKAGCTRFRYGQCNRSTACLGPIVCRVVTCTPPWQLDPACSSAALTDNNTRNHHRPCLEEHGGPFPDVPPGRYFTEPVIWAVEHGITDGVGDTGRFEPHQPMIRAQGMTFFWRMMGRPRPSRRHGFPDVVPNSYYDDPVSWALAEGITDGFGTTGRYEPGLPVDRAQMVTMMWRLVGRPQPRSAHRFPDVPAGSYFDDAVSWAHDRGITTGDGETGLFVPHRAVTRAEAVTFLWRLAGSAASWRDRTPPPSARF
jgi:hypothetical protein